MWLTALTVVLAALYLYLQSAVPGFAAGYTERQLTKHFKGSAHVTVQAHPFWKLFQGSFDHVTVDGQNWHHGKLVLSHVHLNWTGGKVNMGELEVGVLRFDRPGLVTLSAELPASFLKASIPPMFSKVHPTINVTAQGITVKAKATYANLTLPLTLKGKLVITGDHQSVDFVPTSFTTTKYTLPLPPAQKVFTLSSLPLPKGLSLTIRSVSTLPGDVRIVLTHP